MKKLLLIFAMALFACNAGFAQTAHDLYADSETVYWVDSTANNSKILNTAKFWDNWFLGLHAGGFYSWGSNMGSFFKHLRPAGAISIGKMVAPAGGLRLQGVIGGNYARTEQNQSYYYGAMSANLDGLFDFTNLFLGYQENRKFNLRGILGLGIERTFGFSDKKWNDGIFHSQGENAVAVRVGLEARFRLSHAWDFTFEAVNVFIDDSYDGYTTNNRYDGHVNLFAGLVYRFKNHDGTRQFTYAMRDVNKYDELNQELNRMRAEAAKPVEPNVIIQKKTVKSNQVRSLISFEDGKSAVNKLQQVNVYTAVQAWAQNENSNIYITMNEKATNVDTDLFQKRAQSIKDMMVKEFGVNADHIIIEVEPARISALDPDETSVIVFINE